MSTSPQHALRVLFVTSECTPFAMTGGLGDVSGALPVALREQGLDVRVVLPLYRSVDRGQLEELPGTLLVPTWDGAASARVWRGWLRAGTPVYFIDYPGYFDRPLIYGPNGGAYGDNLVRFAFLSRAAVELTRFLRWTPAVMHANDWQTALVPVYLDAFERAWPLSACASVLTIHNIGFQGVFPVEDIVFTGLTNGSSRGIEHWGSLNLLKAGIERATAVTTVSPSYAREIQTPQFGSGLQEDLRARASDLTGILNGIDTVVWDPRSDPHLPAHFDERSFEAKRECKAALQREAGLSERDDVPLLGVITRLTHQKGMDVLARALPRLFELDLQMVLLGAGDPEIEQSFLEAARRWPDRIRAWVGGYDNGLSHRIEAASDFLLMPSRYEPCGLNQMYSLRYGTLPIARATGGLDDTIEQYDERTGAGTGFKFHDLTPTTLFDVAGWAVSTWYDRPQHIRQMRARGMMKDFSWSAAAKTYEQLYVAASRRHRAPHAVDAVRALP